MKEKSIKIDKSVAKSRDKRSLWFTYNSCIALAVVLAIPLELKNRNVYMSYNFETNYYLPYFDVRQGLVPLPFATIDEPGVNSGTILAYADPNRQRDLKDSNDVKITASNDTIITTEAEELQTTKITENQSQNRTKLTERIKPMTDKFNHSETVTEHPKIKKGKKKIRKERQILSTLLSRKKFYRILEDKMEKAGFNGEECLLKAICEAAELPFEEHNGVLGDIVHIMFSPSTSRSEKLPHRYYEAENDGQAGLCKQYHSLCPIGIFDFITKTLIK